MIAVSSPVMPAFRFSQQKRTREVNSVTTYESIHESLILPHPHVSIEQAYKDFRREGVVINGVVVYPTAENHDDEVIRTVEMLIQRFQRLSAPAANENIANIVLQRACRTSSGADSFLAVRKKFLVDGTVLVQRHKERDIGTMTRIDIYLENGSLGCSIKSTNIYALYDTNTIDDSDAFTPPLFTFHTVVTDTSNFATEENSRVLYVHASKYIAEVMSTSIDSDRGSTGCESPS